MTKWLKTVDFGVDLLGAKTTLQSHDSYSTQKHPNTNLIFEK